MLQLAKSLMDERKVAESTANAYIKSLYQLNEKKPFKNLTFLKNTEGVDKIISGYAETTQRALLATIVSVLSLFKDKATFKRVYKHYYDNMMEKSKAVRETEGKNEKTEKQKENWLSWKTIEERRKDLADEVEKFSKKKTITPAQFETLTQCVVLSLYTDVQPRRNQDYLDMYIVKAWNDKMPADKNYLDIKGKKFVFNKYKTAKKYGTQTMEIPDSLWVCISNFLKHHPLWKGDAKRKAAPVKFLVGPDGSPTTAVNAITRILNRIFGKRVGSSMLRHIYISDKYGDLIEEQKADAEAMGHSTAVQRDYYKKDEDEDVDKITHV